MILATWDCWYQFVQGGLSYELEDIVISSELSVTNRSLSGMTPELFNGDLRVRPVPGKQASKGGDHNLSHFMAADIENTGEYGLKEHALCPVQHDLHCQGGPHNPCHTFQDYHQGLGS